MSADRLHNWVLRACDVGTFQQATFRIVLGSLGVLHALRLIAQGYPQSRGGSHFNQRQHRRQRQEVFE